MEFALTRKQLKKKQEAQSAATQAGDPASAAPAAPLAVGAPAGPGVDPVTGLPSGYDAPTPPTPVQAPPPAPTSAPPAPASGSAFFTSGGDVLGRQAPPAAGVAPVTDGPLSTPPPPPSFAPLPPEPVAGSFGSSPLHAVTPQAPPPPPPPPPPAGIAVPADPTLSPHGPGHTRQVVGLIDGPRPRGAELATMLVKRYGGFVLLLVIAILLVEFLPSLRHSTTTPSGLGPSHAVAPASSVASPDPGWISTGAGVLSVTASYT